MNENKLYQEAKIEKRAIVEWAAAIAVMKTLLPVIGGILSLTHPLVRPVVKLLAKALLGTIKLVLRILGSILKGAGSVAIEVGKGVGRAVVKTFEGKRYTAGEMSKLLLEMRRRFINAKNALKNQKSTANDLLSERIDLAQKQMDKVMKMLEKVDVAKVLTPAEVNAYLAPHLQLNKELKAVKASVTIEKLVRLADGLDRKGLVIEANSVDEIIHRAISFKDIWKTVKEKAGGAAEAATGLKDKAEKYFSSLTNKLPDLADTLKSLEGKKMTPDEEKVAKEFYSKLRELGDLASS